MFCTDICSQKLNAQCSKKKLHNDGRQPGNGLLMRQYMSITGGLSLKPRRHLLGCMALLGLSAVCHAQVGLEIGSGELHRAAEKGNTDEVKRLIEAGVAVDVRATGSRATPLHFAARDGHYAVAKLLMELGADVNAQTEYGNTPLHLTARSRLGECANPWRGDSVGLTKDHLAVAELLLESGASVDARNREGTTPLQGAAACNDVRIAALLIDHGANVDSRGSQYSVLDQAIYWGPEVAMLLVASGAEVNTFVPYSGETPLIIAVKRKRTEITRMLLEAGADPNARHRGNNRTALDYAVSSGEAELVKILREYGAQEVKPGEHD